jgi:hypothetical protein
MNRFVARVGSIAVLTAIVCSAPRASALGPVDLEIGAKAGVGTNPSSGTINPLGFGIGGRVGVAILGIYGGVNVLYYLGGSDSGVSVHTLQYGIEGGYGVKLLDDILTIRPQIGLGNVTFSTSGTFAGISLDQSKSYIYVEPGVTGLIALGGFFVGADANILVIPGVDEGGVPNTTKTWTAFTLHGQVGLKF